MRIGLISDTHGYLEPRLEQYLRDVDEIWHAGDIGDINVIRELEKWKPVRAVFGNIDDRTARGIYPEDLWLDVEGVAVWVTHIAGRPPRFLPRIRKELDRRAPAVLIGGHSHICQVHRDKRTGLIYLNPGAAGNQGFHRIRTMMRFSIEGGKLLNLEVIELGARGLPA